MNSYGKKVLKSIVLVTLLSVFLPTLIFGKFSPAVWFLLNVSGLMCVKTLHSRRCRNMECQSWKTVVGKNPINNLDFDSPIEVEISCRKCGQTNSYYISSSRWC